MSIIYRYEPDYAVECAAILVRALAPVDSYNKELRFSNISAFLKEMRHDYPTQIDELSKRLEPLVGISDYIMGNITASAELLSFYFGTQPDCRLSLGVSIALMQMHGLDAAEINPEEKKLALIGLIYSIFNQGDDTDAPKTEEAFIEWLEDERLCAQDKLNCLVLYHSSEKHQRRCGAILDEAKKLYCDKRDIWEPILTQCIDNFKQRAGESGIKEYLKNRFHISIENEEIEISPSLSHFNSLMATQFGVADIIKSDKMMINLGFIVEELFEFNAANAYTNEVLCSQLKTISDSRRLEILKILKEESLCGQELAARLALTPATISHHMNELVSSGFVSMSKAGSRFNYSYIKSGVEELIRNLQSRFL